jgi:hypothetical protein
MLTLRVASPTLRFRTCGSDDPLGDVECGYFRAVEIVHEDYET